MCIQFTHRFLEKQMEYAKYRKTSFKMLFGFPSLSWQVIKLTHIFTCLSSLSLQSSLENLSISLTLCWHNQLVSSQHFNSLHCKSPCLIQQRPSSELRVQSIHSSSGTSREMLAVHHFNTCPFYHTHIIQNSKQTRSGREEGLHQSESRLRSRCTSLLWHLVEKEQIRDTGLGFGGLHKVRSECG